MPSPVIRGVNDVRMLGRALAICFLLTAGVMTAQTPILASRVRERMSARERERMHWEAQQTWFTPIMLGRREPPENRRLHIESGSEPALHAPKLRREWLQPSPEPTTPRITDEESSGLPNLWLLK